jgi:hypothetical protein
MNPKELKQMAVGTKKTNYIPRLTGRYQTEWCNWGGWVKKPMPNLNRQVMPEKGRGNAQDMQT